MKYRFCALFAVLILLLVLGCSGCGQNHAAENSETEHFLNLPLNQYDKAGFVQENGRIFYENAMSGIDVSSHQEEIDWSAVKADGIDFAIIRVGYRGYTNGGLHMDPYFVQNLQEAKDAGLLVGAYLFSQAVTVSEAEEEAAFVLSALDGEALDLPIFYDWEPVEDESRTQDMTGREVTDFALAFCQKIEDAGYRAGVYFNESMGYGFFRLPELQQYDFWLAQYLPVPDFYYDFDVWQYSAEGTVQGIDTEVDLNLWLAD